MEIDRKADWRITSTQLQNLSLKPKHLRTFNKKNANPEYQML
jgi:hypothetical protein